MSEVRKNYIRDPNLGPVLADRCGLGQVVVKKGSQDR